MNLRYAPRSEETEQINLMNWARTHEYDYPELKWLMHIPNGGKRNRAEAAKFKQLGVKAGVSDLFLPAPKGVYNGLFIEMKYGDNTLQKCQKEFLKDMSDAGYYVCTCYDGRTAVKVIEEYINLNTEFDMPTAVRYIKMQRNEPIVHCFMRYKNNSIIKEGDYDFQERHCC